METWCSHPFRTRRLSFRLPLYLALTLTSLGASCSRAALSPGPGRDAWNGASGAEAPSSGPPSPRLQQAESASQRFIIVDGHVDLPFRLELGLVDGRPSEDVSARTALGEFDYPRARQGGLDAPFMSIFVPASYQVAGGARAFADHLIDLVEGLVQQHPAKFALAATPAEVRASAEAGKIALPLGIENGAALEGRLENVSHFRGRGVSYITLTHSRDNDISDTSYESVRTHHGLSDFGKRVVAEMNRVGVMVDVSHVSDDAFLQAVELSRVPVIASHSSLRHFVPGFERNISDDMLRRLAARGGVVMVNFGSAFLRADSNGVSERRKLAAVAYASEQHLDMTVRADRKRIEDHVAAELPMPLARVEDVADHIDRIKALVGIDHVGLGSDYEGVGPTLPVGLEDVSRYPNLLVELIERGYTDAELEQICSGNVLRVWQSVVDFASKAALAPAEALRPRG
jgi:membrane dipeptidase